MAAPKAAALPLGDTPMEKRTNPKKILSEAEQTLSQRGREHRPADTGGGSITKNKAQLNKELGL